MQETTKCQGCGASITPADATHCETCTAEEIADAVLIASVQKALTPYVVSGQLHPTETDSQREARKAAESEWYPSA